MFTGIVEEAGKVTNVRSARSAVRVDLQCHLVSPGLKIGDSVAVNGCCLTLVARKAIRGKSILSFDLLRETWTRTNLQFLSPGDPVNLERGLLVGDRLGGHFVTGHVDGMGVIRRWERSGKDHVMEVQAPREMRPLLVFKGSIAVDGISLTISKVLPNGFQIWIIPHTLEVTQLGHRRVGDYVNLETDLLGKYVLNLLPQKRVRPSHRRKP
jgi:riboflavin synthase